MKIERAERKESQRRSQSPQEAKELFLVMCSGSEDGSKWCLRAKIDMSSDNGTMRDPVLFRYIHCCWYCYVTLPGRAF